METANKNIINVQEIPPQIRHQTIFDTFDELKEGESLTIHNNHDPQPVYYQLLELYGESFTWEYLQRGPEWWDILVTKINLSKETSKEIGADEMVLDIPAIEDHQLKHQAIFQAFEELEPGTSFIIHNDHDPKPVYFQLQSLFGDIFDWEYINRGPQVFDIRVTKSADAPASQSTFINELGETVVDVPAIMDHHTKHETIFKVFENTKPGESFIIHNDHDPKPVFFQLQQMNGDTFTWDYLEEGPQYWDIRVKIKPITMQTNNSEEEIVIDVPSIEPHSKKHEKIFQTFDNLSPGASFIIHNDHDPKPVYYQLQSMHGDVFTWEYLENGPQVWNIRVTLKGNESKETVGEIVTKDIANAEVFKKFGIDFCCNGNKTVAEACKEKGIDVAEVEEALQKPIENVTGGNMNFDEWDLDFLADYIVNTHHKYVKKYLPEIVKYSNKVAQVHGPHHPELLPINELVNEVKEAFYSHMDEEENKLFPMVKQIVKAKEENTSFTADGDESFKAIVEKSEEEHNDVGNALREIRRLSDNFALPEDACASYTLLYKMIEEFENDTFTHIHLENNMLFPKAQVLEESLA